MTYSVHNLTENAQMSIKGTGDANRPFALGISLDTKCLEKGVDGDYCYETVDWDKAVKMAEWILEENEWIQDELKRMGVASVGRCER